MAFIDFKKAFDKMDKNKLFEILQGDHLKITKSNA
jgi:hypothetical protein